MLGAWRIYQGKGGERVKGKREKRRRKRLIVDEWHVIIMYLWVMGRKVEGRKAEVNEDQAG